MNGNKSDAPQTWPYPGSRWWKFDFHTHTPASTDTKHWQDVKGTPDEVTPEQWLLKYMQAGIDCVAVTDHNSGAWIDEVKAANQRMKSLAERGEACENYREITLFPGVEISVSGGFHLLAIFDVGATTRTINDLLAAVRYRGSDGDSDGVTSEGPERVVIEILEAGGIPVLAHADSQKGLLAVQPGTKKCQLDPNTVKQILDIEELRAAEWVDKQSMFPELVEKRCSHLAMVLGSDSHSFQGNAVPGSRYTWVKMARPNLEGLRLAILDGNDISIRRSDDDAFEPYHTPEHVITAIQIQSARYMGNGRPARVEFNPFYNALIGGRGTGKSTIVHALRLAYRRQEDLKRLEGTEPFRQFELFAKTSKGREGEGALREKTEILIEVERDGIPHRLRWRADGQGEVVEEKTSLGVWKESTDPTINAERFPIRLFSQGQIAALAGENRQALLDVIDEAANVAPLKRNFEDLKQTYFTQRAKLRELSTRLQEQPKLERELKDVLRKLEAFSQSHHAEVLKAHQIAQRQQREVIQTQEQLDAFPKQIESVLDELVLDDWPESVFDGSSDADILSWRSDAEAVLAGVRKTLSEEVSVFKKRLGQLHESTQIGAWRNRVFTANENYKILQSKLVEQGVTDPQAFGRLVQERQKLEGQIKQLSLVQEEKEELVAKCTRQWQELAQARKAISEARNKFIQETLGDNTFVRMTVVSFGYDAKAIDQELRALLDITPGKFESDLLQRDEGGEPESGLAYELIRSSDREEALNSLKRRLLNGNELGGHFRNFLQRKRENTPSFADQVICWFPEDDLKIEYSRSGEGTDWRPITQGSQGQRSAALLAFLLAFGKEPLVLDQPEDDLDNHLIYDLIVRQIRANKQRRQLIIVTHNPNVVVNGDAEMVHAFDFLGGQCGVVQKGALQEKSLRDEVCRVMEGGLEAFSRRWARLGREK
ncbi:TrlF family AAA-like ATPase [Marinobacter lacisalsi]|uniref:TrlF family AAA-like ATPase n=1 Tax=Marinobacter lacisalsi TaxID=475979 RepID=A0ABV8QGU2_9GAMM